jgi:hypothetical protein
MTRGRKKRTEALEADRTPGPGLFGGSTATPVWVEWPGRPDSLRFHPPFTLHRDEAPSGFGSANALGADSRPSRSRTVEPGPAVRTAVEVAVMDEDTVIDPLPRDGRWCGMVCEVPFRRYN